MKLWLKVVLAIVTAIVILLALVGFWGYSLIVGSLPILEGEIQISGFSDEVTIERDKLGVPTIRGRNQEDVARALGFIHGQDRFFQMDLMRRQAAGELAELIGEAVLNLDRSNRVHQFRQRAKRVINKCSARHLRVVKAYVQGVNSGLNSLKEKPFEYHLLRTEPARWTAEDSVLVIIAMFFVLNDEEGRTESNYGLLYDLLPPELADFVAPEGTRWDAPILGEPFVSDSIPGPEILDLRKTPAKNETARVPAPTIDPKWFYGSNNWAVAGSRTRDGRAIVADDMHLGLSVPNTWYRAHLEWPGTTVTGVTLPGAPVVVVGSNGDVAWGFTNSSGDWVDLVILQTDPGNPERYLTPEGYRSFDIDNESIRIKGQKPQILEIRRTIWGPVIDQDHQGRFRALRWIAHDVDGVNLVHLDLVSATDVQEALNIANLSGIPPQNLVCADSQGSIAWTIEGRIPRRIGFEGRYPSSWSDGSRRWDGYLEPDEYPRIINPETGALWTANSRVVDGEMLKKIGYGGYDLGARTKQIRDSLLELDPATEADMLRIQLDHRALFLERWRGLLIDLLTENRVDDNQARMNFLSWIQKGWTGSASIDSVGYRLVRAFRSFTDEKVFNWLTQPCREADERFGVYSFNQREQSLWLLVNRKPLHLLNPPYESWDEFLLSIVDQTIEYYGGSDKLPEKTWGDLNTIQIRHPISRALPFLSSWLDMPAVQLPGDHNMPRAQGIQFGASERLGVSPGREQDGYFHMPVGQCGHPLSEYYRAGHDAWVDGRATPFLPGETEKILRLVP